MHGQVGMATMYVTNVLAIWLFVKWSHQAGNQLGIAWSQLKESKPGFENALLTEALKAASASHLYKSVDREMTLNEAQDGHGMQSEFKALYKTNDEVTTQDPVGVMVDQMPDRKSADQAMLEYDEAVANLAMEFQETGHENPLPGQDSAGEAQTQPAVGQGSSMGMVDCVSVSIPAGSGSGCGGDVATPEAVSAVLGDASQLGEPVVQSSLQRAGEEVQELEEALMEKRFAEQKFAAHMQGHIVLAVRSFKLFEQQQFHGMMRLLGFEGNYHSQLNAQDHAVFFECLQLYNGQKDGEAEARAKREAEEREAARLREELGKLAIEKQKEKAALVAACTDLDEEVRRKRREYKAQFDQSKSLERTLKELKEKYDLAVSSVLDSGHKDESKVLQEQSRDKYQSLLEEQKGAEDEVGLHLSIMTLPAMVLLLVCELCALHHASHFL